MHGRAMPPYQVLSKDVVNGQEVETLRKPTARLDHPRGIV